MPDPVRTARQGAEVFSGGGILGLRSLWGLPLSWLLIAGCGPGPSAEDALSAYLKPGGTEQKEALACQQNFTLISSGSASPSAPSLASCSRSLLAPRTELTNEWQSFCLGDGCSQPSWEGGWQGRGIDLRASGPGLQGVFYRHPVQGHFLEEIRLDLPDRGAPPRGIILFPAVNRGKGWLEPDYNAYVALLLDRNEQGYLRVRAHDRQPNPEGSGSVEQLLDRTGRLSPWEREKRYEAVLDGSFAPPGSNRNDYRVPFTDSSGRLRIFHHSNTLLQGREQPFFYLSYSVRKNMLEGTAPAEGWMDLAPLASWLGPWQLYFVGTVMDASYGGQEARFRELTSEQKPREEADEESQSFRLIRRPYHWSGFSGDAWQVQFGKDFPASRRYRLVFWTEMNNVPAWHINDQLLLTNSFIELWPKDREQTKGCFEAMSDGLRWNNEVKIIADNPARKVIHWRSFLLNPAYQTIAQTLGRPYGGSRGFEALPRSDEIWTVYPDGSVFRQMSYTPDTEGYGDDSYEIAELSVIAGTRSTPEDHAQSGAALELWNPISSDHYKFRPSHGRDLDGNSFGKRDAPFDWWDQTVAVVKLKDGQSQAPYIYSAFAQPWAAPRVSGSHQLDFDISWHGFEWQFSHWPVHREAYEWHDQTRSTWDSQVSHSALVSVQVTDGGRTPGTKSFVSLLGMNYDAGAISARVQDWAYPPEISKLDSCQSPWFDPRQGHLELNWRGSRCSFELSSKQSGRDSVPLILKMRGVWNGQQFRLRVNDQELGSGDWQLGFEYTAGVPEAIFFIPARKGGIWKVELSS